MDKPKLPGWSAFDKLARQVASVPKDKVDARIARDKAKRIAARKKK